MSYGILFAEATHGIDLILHQGDQWRDDHGRPLHQKGWELIAETLPSASRHEDKGIMTCEDTLDDLPLVPLELVEAKVLLKGFCKVDTTHGVRFVSALHSLCLPL